MMGLPGSGKTYFCRQVIERIRKNGAKSENLVDAGRTRFAYKVLYKILRSAPPMTKEQKALRAGLQEIVAQDRGKTANYNTVGIDSYIRDIEMLIRIKKRFSEQDHIYFLDEGIAQRIVTMGINYDLRMEQIHQLLDVLEPYIDETYYLEMDTDAAFASIRKRNRNVCVMDRLNDEDLRRFLTDYKKLCDVIADRIHAETISRGDEAALAEKRFGFRSLD